MWLLAGLLGLPALAQETRRIAQGYLYVEPYQARFECLVDLRTMLDWLAMPGTLGNELSAAQVDAVLAKAGSLASAWASFRVQGAAADGQLVVAQLVRGEPGRTLPMPEGGMAPVNGTMLGLMWECPAGAEPHSIQVVWQGFIPFLKTLPVSVFFGGNREEQVLTEFNAVCRWSNDGRLLPPPPLAPVPPLQERPTFLLPAGAIAWLLVGLIIAIPVLRGNRRRRRVTLAVYASVWLLGALITVPLLVLRLPKPGTAEPSAVAEPDQAAVIVEPLLRNVYRAFDYRSEGDIYDVLARSAAGPLLKTLYLDTIAALSLDEAEAARVRVAEFACEVLAVTPAVSGKGFAAKTSWTTLGSVGHWGHTHMRTNVCLGDVTVEDVDGSWKITAVEMLDHRRL